MNHQQKCTGDYMHDLLSRTKVPAKDFTLIELLVVIAVISLLMAILMPALNRVRQQARRVICSSHMKQMCTAVSYSQTKDDDYETWDRKMDKLRR